MKLYDGGLVDIDDHSGTYLLKMKGFNKRVTLRHMLHHISDLPDFAQDLSFITVVAVKIWFRSIAEMAGAVIGNVAFFTPCNGFDLYVIAVFKVRNQQTPVPFVVKIFDLGEFISFELLGEWEASKLN